ncbi:MAG TPA: hypothetical protein VGS41_19415 [Chthonomonadales bacterium]|nr:hypothetical protein [Chthonomonadales bacterium]
MSRRIKASDFALECDRLCEVCSRYGAVPEVVRGYRRLCSEAGSATGSNMAVQHRMAPAGLAHEVHFKQGRYRQASAATAWTNRPGPAGDADTTLIISLRCMHAFARLMGGDIAGAVRAYLKLLLKPKPADVRISALLAKLQVSTFLDEADPAAEAPMMCRCWSKPSSPRR